METPIPVTAVSAEALEAMAPDHARRAAVSQLPQFYGNQTPNSRRAGSPAAATAILDMRGLGINRTLTLLNGRRMPSSNAFGGVDINVFPKPWCGASRSVTGGASAAYGTDAVAGVVNFLIDTDFTGARCACPGRDHRPRRQRILRTLGAWGMRLRRSRPSPRLRRVFDQNGVHNYEDRDWYQAWGTVPDATGQLLIRAERRSRATRPSTA